MKRVLQCCLVGIMVLPAYLAAQSRKANALTLEVMNPRAEIPPPPSFPPSPRVKELGGMRIGIYWIGKAGGDNFFDGLEQLMKEKYPTTKTVRYSGGFDLGDTRATEIAKEVDTVVYGVGD